jgi:hypothetical protein
MFGHPEVEHSEPDSLVSREHGRDVHPRGIFGKEGACGSMARVQLVEGLLSKRRIGMQRRDLEQFAERRSLSVIRHQLSDPLIANYIIGNAQSVLLLKLFQRQIDISRVAHQAVIAKRPADEQAQAINPSSRSCSRSEKAASPLFQPGTQNAE